MKIKIALNDAAFEVEADKEFASDASHLADRFYDSLHAEPGSLDRKLDQLLRQGAQLMTKADDANAALDRINTATNNIAADIRGLKVEPGMTQAEADAVNARLSGVADTLEALAAETPDAPPA